MSTQLHSVKEIRTSVSAGVHPELSAVRFVRELGIRPNLAGYRYLVTAVSFGMRKPHLLHSLTHGLYPAIAQHYQVNLGVIERNIRRAIEAAYDNDPVKIQSVFYYKVGKPSVSEVIALAVDTIQMQIK